MIAPAEIKEFKTPIAAAAPAKGTALAILDILQLSEKLAATSTKEAGIAATVGKNISRVTKPNTRYVKPIHISAIESKPFLYRYKTAERDIIAEKTVAKGEGLDAWLTAATSERFCATLRDNRTVKKYRITISARPRISGLCMIV
jgi:hypothetical protein